MKGLHILPLFLTILFLSLTAISTADTIPAEIAYVQGNHYEMSNGTDGMSELIITDIIPYFDITNGNSNKLIPVKNLSDIITPVNAALVLSDSGNETVSLVTVSNITLSDNMDMVLQIKPLEFYDGEILKSFNLVRSDLPSSGTGMSIYLEIHQIPSNGKKFHPQDPSPILE